MLLAGADPQSITVNERRWPDPLNYLVARQFFFDSQVRVELAETEDVRTIVQIAERPRKYSWKKGREGTPEDPHMYWRDSYPNILRRVVHELMRVDVAVPTLAPDSCPVPSLRPLLQHWPSAHDELQARIERVGKQALLRWQLPAWLKYPEIPKGSIGWRMGYGESYIYQQSDWLRTLPRKEQRAFETAYPRWLETFE